MKNSETKSKLINNIVVDMINKVVQVHLVIFIMHFFFAIVLYIL